MIPFSTAARAASVYQQTILTASDPATPAPNHDPNLKNPWGISFSLTSPFWNADQRSGVSTLYNGAGVPNALVVQIPGGSPTGTVFNGTTDFRIPPIPALRTAMRRLSSSPP